MRSFRTRALTAAAVLAIATAVALIFGEPPVGVIIAAAVLVSAGLGLLITAIGSIASSARVMAGASREIAQGQFTVRLEGGPNDEIGLAYAEFNRMAARLESLVDETSQEDRSGAFCRAEDTGDLGDLHFAVLSDVLEGHHLGTADLAACQRIVLTPGEFPQHQWKHFEHLRGKTVE